MARFLNTILAFNTIMLPERFSNPIPSINKCESGEGTSTVHSFGNVREVNIDIDHVNDSTPKLLPTLFSGIIFWGLSFVFHLFCRFSLFHTSNLV